MCGEWLRTWFGFANHLAPIACFISYEKWFKRESMRMAYISSKQASKHIVSSLHPLLVKYETRGWCKMTSKLQIMPTLQLLVVSRAHMNILIIIKANKWFMLTITIAML